MPHPNANIHSIFFGMLLFSLSHLVAASELSGKGDLLSLANSIVKTDAQVNQEREALFQLKLEEQLVLYGESKSRLAVAEREQKRLQTAFDKNEEVLVALQKKLQLRSGALGEVFGVAKETSLELLPMLKASPTSADHLGRADSLAFAESKRVPTLADFQALAQALSSEMEASGKVASFPAKVVDENGRESEQVVYRFGVFSAASESGRYLLWDSRSQALKELPIQPGHRVSVGENKLMTTALLDPLRGELFALLEREPSIVERVEQGGAVGYLILSLGLLGLLVALYQLARLLFTEIAVRRQLASEDVPDRSNPLGRVLASISLDGTAYKGDSDGLLEAKVDEAVLKELPKLEQGQGFLKLLAAVAPLLGLLGTVIGMIATFQSITLFGTSDPKLMANGISQALMTTVFGLVVAVPILFCHSVLVSRANRLVQILQEKSLGMLASKLGSQEQVVRSELHVA